MKQETTPASKPELRGGGTSQSPTTSTAHSRLRASAKSRSSPKLDPVVNGALSPRGRAKPNPDAIKTNLRGARRSLLLTKPKSQDETLGSQKGPDVGVAAAPSPNRPVAAEQFARPRRLLRSLMDSGSRRNEKDPDGKYKELTEKVELGESLINNLQDQVLGLKAELEKAQSLNMELHSQNTKLTENLSAAEAKIATLTSPQQNSIGEYQRPNFKDIQKLIANKLENSKVKREGSITEVCIVKLPSPGPPPPPSQRMLRSVDAERKAPPHNSQQQQPPPPPPPPPPCPPAIPAAPRKATSFQEFYQSLTKQEGKKAPALPGSGSLNKPRTTSAHNSIVGEIQNRSAHLLAVKADIATKGDFINGLIQKVQSAAYTNIEDVLKFVDWLDSELSSLADERAVLKHFKWPERKADTMREAAVEYRDLKLLENEISAFQDDTSMPCEVALKRMANLLDKSERSIQRLIKLRSSATRSYQECKIPTDWMLDSGIVSKIKKASMKLAKVYMNRVTMELESIRNSDRESAQEALLLQGLHFAYRAHQFAGGLDSETMCAFEEIRQRVPGHLGGSAESLSAITTSS